MSFFDDDDEPPTAIRAPRDAPRPRRPAASARTHSADRQQILVRRAAAAGAILVVIVVLVLGISGCERSAAKNAITAYNTAVSKLIETSNVQIAVPLFADLKNASGKSALDVGVEINGLRIDAQNDVTTAAHFSVPSQLTAAQTFLLLVLDLREEALTSIAAEIPLAMGSSDAQAAITRVAGQMEVILGADVVYAERVAPLIAQTLAANGLTGSPPASRWLTNLSWLEPATVATKLTGVKGTGNNGQPLAPGTHGHVLTGVSVGSNTLATGVVNHIADGANPTFNVAFTNDSDNAATDVRVEVAVTALGKTYRNYATVPKTTPGQSLSVDIPLTGVPLNVPATATAIVLKVPGEMNTANNRASYTAIFS